MTPHDDCLKIKGEYVEEESLTPKFFFCIIDTYIIIAYEYTITVQTRQLLHH